LVTSADNDNMDNPGPHPARGLTVWFTGLSSSGKTTLSRALHDELKSRGHPVEWLDGDAVRQKLSKDLGYSREDRNENIRRIGALAQQLTRRGTIVLVSAISPYRAAREEVRRRIGDFLEIWVHAPLAVCESRDRNGIYRRARAHQLQHVTGIDDPYEEPLTPDVECCTDRETLAESVAKVLAAVERKLSER
jgi:adenylyl-sulfate kinase